MLKCWDGKADILLTPPEAMANDTKDSRYWNEEIAFLTARLNGEHGDIDRDDRAACEEALKAATMNLNGNHPH